MTIPEEELEVINYFNDCLPSLGWLRVNLYSPALEQALDYWLMQYYDVEGIYDLIDKAAANSPDIAIPKTKTLVRLLRDNQ